MNLTRKSPRFVALAALMATLGLNAAEADACGGLFCSASTPVNQAAERIIFAHDDAAGRVTAVIEILYDGPADAFAWILPVPGTPDVGVSTNALLNRLQQATNPNYQLQRNWPNSTCDGATASRGGSGGSASFAPPAVADGEESVRVLASGTAGPYDYEVIDVADDVAGDPAAEAITWLEANGYDPGATGPDLLRPYLESGLNLLAIKLTKQASVGSIRPIKISYESALPMIPIRPTAVAANENMGVLVWVLGSSRAVPFNYKALELNEALLDWFNTQQSYNDVVIAAANETTDGQGFVTEFARATNDPTTGSNIVDQIYFERGTIQDFRNVADGLSDVQLVVQTVNRFSTFNGNFGLGGPFGAASPSGQVSLDGVADALSENLVLPAGVSIADVLASPNCYFEELEDADAFYCNGMPAPAERIDLTNFNRTAFLTDVEQLVIAPIEQTVQLFVERPYMTRFYTTLSAGEMTVDPLFALNPDLEDVANQHTLTLDYEGCAGDTSGEWEAEVSGRVVRGTGNVWPLTLADRDPAMPVNLRILQLSAAGPGQVYEDNSDLIEQLLQTQFGRTAPGTDPGSDPIVIQSSSGCSLGGASAPAQPRGVAWFLLGLALWGVCRRGV